MKEKVQCLQQYVPKLLKAKVDSKKREDKDNSSITDRRMQSKRILQIVKDIARELIKKKNPKIKQSEANSKSELKPHQIVRIEDLL